MNKKEIAEISNKIAWEGGIFEAFVSYGLDTSDSEINAAAAELNQAYTALEDLLLAKGVDPEGIEEEEEEEE